MSRLGTIVVLAKEPVPGRVKTRLCPPFNGEEAAELAAAALADTLDAVSAARCARRVIAFDGDPQPWAPPGFDRVMQVRGGLDARLTGAFAATRGPTVLIGMDTPQVAAALLEHALDALHGHDAVLGPACDGGYWLVGLRTPDRRCFRGVPMSTAETCARQRQRFDQLGFRTRIISTLRDFDDADAAAAVAIEAPESRFATVHRQLMSPISARSAT